MHCKTILVKQIKQNKQATDQQSGQHYGKYPYSLMSLMYEEYEGTVNSQPILLSTLKKREITSADDEA